MSEKNISSNGNLPAKINLNTAAADELGQVPGVGPTMAKRIMAARPFNALDDLQRVSGIGPSVMERIKPYITLDNAEVQTEPDGERVFETAMLVDETFVTAEDMDELDEEDLEIIEAEVVEDLDLEAGEEMAEEVVDVEAEQPVEKPKEDSEEDWVARVLSTEPATPPEPVLPKSPPAAAPSIVTAAPSGVTRGQVLWIAVGSSLLAFLLAIALSLGVLASLNDGQLQFASPGQIIDLNRQVTTLNEQAQTLDGDIGGLRTRLDNLEPSGRSGGCCRTDSGRPGRGSGDDGRPGD